MKSATDQNPKFGDKNIFKLLPNNNAYSKEYFLSNGAAFTLSLKFNERKQTYSIEVTNVKGNFKDIRFCDIPKNVIICKESIYKFECMVLSNLQTNSSITLYFIVSFDLKLYPTSANSAHNVVFKHGLFRSLAYDRYIQFYIRQSGNERLYCIIRKIFGMNDSTKTLYFIYFNCNNKDGEEDEPIIKETCTEKFMILAKKDLNEMEEVCLKMLEDAILSSSSRKNSMT